MLNVIDGTVIVGSSDIIVEHVTIHPQDLKDKSAFFLFVHNDIDWKAISFDPIVIITDLPTQFMEREEAGNNVTVVKVSSIENAYWSFIDYYRNIFTLPVIGITGTCGKTTTTEMVKHILSRKMNIQATFDGRNNIRNNLNYLMGIDEKTKAAVFEMGVTHPGCIRYSSRYLKPTIGVLLNIGVYHLLGCKTFENYVKAKCELIESLPSDGILIINTDDENIRSIDLGSFKGKVITFGSQNAADYRASHIEMKGNHLVFVLQYNGKSHHIVVPGVGVHNVYNAVAAIAVAHALGIEIEEASTGLKTFSHMRQHLQIRKGLKNSTIIDDTWNCTPLSVKTALDTLKQYGDDRRKAAVIGYMPQLGENGIKEYDRIAEIIVNMEIDHLILIGEADRIGKKAIELGMDKDRITFARSGKDVYYSLLPHMSPQSIILFKFPYTYRLSKDPSFQHLMKVIFA